MSIRVNKLDLDFARIAWSINQIAKGLNKHQKLFIQGLFTKYCDYTRGDESAREQVSRIINALYSRKIVEKPEQMIPSIPARPEAVFAMKGEPTVISKTELRKSPEGRKIREIVYKKLTEKIGADELQQLYETKDKDELKKDLNTSLDNSARIIMQQQQEAKEMTTAMLTHLRQFSEENKANQVAMEVHVTRLTKQNIKIQQDIRQLYEMQLQTKSLTDLKWQQIPDWFKEMFSGGLKRMAYNLVTLPLKIAGILTDRIIYRPMVRAYDFWYGKVELVAGTILWIMVIGATVHILYITDWEEVNKTFQQYGGTYIQKYALSVSNLLSKNIQAYMPGIREMVESNAMFFWVNVVNPILGFLWTMWQGLLAILTMAFNKFIQELPGSSLWFTPADVTWPNSQLFAIAREWFVA